MDPDPIGSKTFSGSGKNNPDPDPSSSGFSMNLKYNYSEKLVQFDNISTKMLNKVGSRSEKNHSGATTLPNWKGYSKTKGD